MHYKEIINHKGWRDNCFSRAIVKRNITASQLALELRVPLNNLLNWLKKDESDFSATVSRLSEYFKAEGLV